MNKQGQKEDRHDLASRFFNGVTLVPEGEITDSNNPCTSLVLGQTSVELEAQVIMHEIGHLFGAVDHNKQDMTGIGNYDHICMYGSRNIPEGEADVSPGLMICNACRNMIESNKHRYDSFQ